MQTSQLATLFIFLSITVSNISCFPSKPLNERSTELTWQAWLLIDETQNKQQQQDTTLRRRITPKSVFIAPTFSPESLPECSEGYQSDSMGRCIKIIMLNKERHLDFLLSQLNQKFGGMLDYEEEEFDLTTSGPFNINIPINNNNGYGEIQKETDVAIVVAPTNNLLRSEAEMQMQLNKTLSEEKVNVDAIAGILGVRQADQVETTTVTSTANTDTTTQMSTSTSKNTETTTLNTETSTELTALFFLDQKRQVEVKTVTDGYHQDDNSRSSSFTTVSSTLDVETTETTTQIKRETTEDAKLGHEDEIPYVQMDQALPNPESYAQFIDVKREAVHKLNSDEVKPISDLDISFGMKTTSIMPETKFNNLNHHHQQASMPNDGSSVGSFKKKPEESTTSTTTLMLTPIDNSLTNQEDLAQSTSSSTSSGSSTKLFFPNGFQKPNYETLYNSDNIKFFLRPEQSSSPTITEQIVQETSEAPNETTEISTTDATTIDTSTYVNLLMLNSEANTSEFPQTESKVVKFPTDVPQFVRFPTEDPYLPSHQPFIQSDFRQNYDDVSKQFGAILNRYTQVLPQKTIPDNKQQVGKNNPTHVDLSQTLYQRYKAHRDNHRNREKHSEWFHLPAKWSDNSQKPVVLRFSRKHGYIDSQQLGSNNFYREINPRMFGFPAKTRVQR